MEAELLLGFIIGCIGLSSYSLPHCVPIAVNLCLPPATTPSLIEPMKTAGNRPFNQITDIDYRRSCIVWLNRYHLIGL